LTLGCPKRNVYDISEIHIQGLPIKIRSSADTTTSAVKKVRFMKLYKNLTLMVLFGMTLVMLGMSAAANGTAIDPGVGLRGDGASELVGQTFGGGFQTTATDAFVCATSKMDGSPTGDLSNTNCFQNNTATYIALNLVFTNPPSNPSLTYSCDNSLDPFFLYCSGSGNEVTFYGLSGEVSTDFLAAYVQPNDCGDGGCQGIQNLNHFLLALENLDGSADVNDTGITYTAVADLAVGSTPEPASVLLFVIAMGAIALFFKRA
jgi:hypothetical protein